jgi:hypothetical protein
MEDMTWEQIDHLIHEMIQGQHSKVLACGRRIIPTLTTEDALQPNDYPELENHPTFRYEEGHLAGIHSVQMALWALRKSTLQEPIHSISE